MSPASYSPDALLADESFQDWILGGDAAAEQFWQQWLQANPTRSAEFDEAIVLLRQLRPNQRVQPPAGGKESELAKL